MERFHYFLPRISIPFGLEALATAYAVVCVALRPCLRAIIHARGKMTAARGAAMWRLICLLIGYAFGNLLFADFLSRLRAHTSIFELGNGNPGMANAARSLGKTAAIACLAGDILKVVAAVLVCRTIYPAELPPLVRGWACIGATLGHDFPIWHGFKGGKGVTTLSSALVLIDWRGAIIAALVAAAAIYLSGYLSIAAVAAAGAFVIWAVVMLPGEGLLLAVLAFALALYGQWTNLRGIGDGTAKRDFTRRK